MIRIVCCPACKTRGVLLADVDEGALVACVSCDEEFEPLVATVESLPLLTPPVSLVEPDGDSDELELQDAKQSSSAPAKDPSAWQDYEPITHTQFERLKRKSRSPIWSVLQISLGGLAAIPIALLILWHGLGRDVMDAGPTVAKYAPWIVPEQFHPLQPMDDQDDSPPAPRQRGGFRNFDSELGMSGQPLEQPLDPDAATPNTATPKAPSSESSGASASPPSGTVNRQSVERQFPFTQGLFRSIAGYERDLTSWLRASGDDAEDRRRIAKNLYGDLLSIAMQMDQFPGESPAFKFVRAEMTRASSRVKQDVSTQELINAGARHTISVADWSSPVPLAFVLENKQAIRDRDQWQLTPEDPGLLDNIPGPIDISLPTYLSPMLIPGQRLFVIGNIRPASPGDAEQRFIFEGNYLYSFGSRGVAADIIDASVEGQLKDQE